MQVAEPVRQLIEFRRLNLLKAPPPGPPLDFIFCRNVHDLLRSRGAAAGRAARSKSGWRRAGYLFISHSESLNGLRHGLAWVAPGHLPAGAAMRDAAACTPLDARRSGVRRVIGIGELVVSNDRRATIATHAIGSCIAVCVFDPVAAVAGMLHFLLPESSINPARAAEQPAAFADTGIPLLFQTAYRLRPRPSSGPSSSWSAARRSRRRTRGSFTTGRRNALAARNLLWRNGVFVAAEDVGGTDARTVHLSVADGRLQIFSGPAYKEL